MARYLITGAAGFIGSHLARRLVEDGHEVVGLDDLSAGQRENLDPRVALHIGDIRSPAIYPLFDGVDGVFHLAAKNCLPDCLKDPVGTASINVMGTANVLEAATRARVGRFAYADTSAEYEGVPDLPSRVDRILPLSVYARSKRSGAMFCEAYRDFHGLRLTVVRYFNVYGPAQDWRRSVPPLMSALAIRMLRGERPVIYGSGKKRRDFVYIHDVTAFNVLALCDAHTDGGVYNVGSGVSYSVNDIFAEVEAQLRTGLTPEYEPDLPGEAEATLADITAERRLGWAPTVGLEDGIARSIAYIKESVLAA